MADYKKMYFALMAKVADAQEILTTALLKAEETYIESEDAPLIMMRPSEETDGNSAEDEDTPPPPSK